LRPFQDLTKHLTTRADDSRATPVKKHYTYKTILICITVLLCQELVRFCADYRIKPHAPPLVLDPRQFLWVPILRSYSSGGVLMALA